MIEINTLLKFEDKVGSEKKSHFEINFSTIIKVNDEVKEKKGTTTQTLINHIDVIIYHKDQNLVNLFVRRSFSEHLWSWINDSASRL